MEVAIIGAGNVGEALARSLTRAGHTVSLTAPPRSGPPRRRSGPAPPRCRPPRKRLAAADAVILTVSNGVINGLREGIAPLLAGKILIDATNRISPRRPGRGPRRDSRSLGHGAALPLSKDERRVSPGDICQSFLNAYAYGMTEVRSG